MTYTPPGYTPAPAIGAGTHTLRLVELKAVDANKFGCSVCFAATYRSDDGAEVTDFMKWGANPIGDKIASDRMDALMQAAGMTGNPSLQSLQDVLASIPLEVEVKENKGYLNIWSVRAQTAAPVAGSESF